MRVKTLLPIVFLITTMSVLTAITDLILPFRLPYKEWFLPTVLQLALIFYTIFIKKRLVFYGRHLNFIVLSYFPIFLMFILEPLRYIIVGDRLTISSYAFFFNHCVFIIFISICYIWDDDFFKKAVNIYLKFSFLIVWTALIVFILLHLGILDLNNWGLPTFFGTGFHAKYELPGAIENIYSVPLYMTVIFPNYVKPFGFFSEFGTFSGLSYEPHIAFFVLAPAFILSFARYSLNLKMVITRVIPFFIFFVLSFSLTGIIALLITGLAYLFFTANKPLSIFLLFSLFVSIVFLYAFSQIVLNIDLELLYYIEQKMESRSGDESVGFINYLSNPLTVWGFGPFNIPTYYGPKYNDVGLLTSLCFFSFYLGICILIYKCLKKGQIAFALVGVYFVMHSLKFPMHMIQYIFPLFIIFLLSKAASCYGRNKLI